MNAIERHKKTKSILDDLERIMGKGECTAAGLTVGINVGPAPVSVSFDLQAEIADTWIILDVLDSVRAGLLASLKEQEYHIREDAKQMQAYLRIVQEKKEKAKDGK